MSAVEYRDLEPFSCQGSSIYLALEAKSILAHTRCHRPVHHAKAFRTKHITYATTIWNISSREMAESTGAPQQYKQPSRKGKKAWRKNVDVSEIQTGLENLREEIIKGSVDAPQVKIHISVLISGLQRRYCGEDFG